MKKTIFLTALLASTAVSASGGGHWGYAGAEGPDNWARLSPDYSACAGKNQSPINLTGFIEAELEPIKFDYKTGGNEILNNGHTVQVNYAKGSSIQVDGRTFNLLQFHFHAPSENHIKGKSYPLEAHLVHADQDGNLAVVALMFTEGAENKGLAKAWSQMPQHAGDKHALSSSVDVNEILPSNRDYYRFNGSLTTPPCSEGVRWLVLKEVATASKAQIEAFAHTLHHPNNRPLQAVNARPVLQ
ncbi:MAG TPA: carbonic anhydrase family protein [Sedimenticola sp.]|nr:carbonic anhydrase family protein [Sedimenticola sp.]